MLKSASRRWLLLIPVFIFFFAAWNYHMKTQDWINHQFSGSHKQDPIHAIAGTDGGIKLPELETSRPKHPEDLNQEKSNPDQSIQEKQHHKESTHDVLYSISTSEKTYFNITMGQQVSFNPNILPHPREPGTFLVVAQQDGRSIIDGRYYSEIFCNAKFTSSSNLECIVRPVVLLIALSQTTHCKGVLSTLSANIGPHDGRVFYGPQGSPYIIYGSQSSHTCMSLWMQNFQVLSGDMVTWEFDNDQFENATEIIRPEPWSLLEKNWFLFWANDDMYVQYDLYPQRRFAKLGLDGSAGPDLAPESNEHDERCLKKLPQIGNDESIHQGTNSLSITLCNRSDSACTSNDDNTFIFSLIEHKLASAFHAVYEPYLVAFRRRSPFDLYAISKKPFWFNGRSGDKDYAQTGELGMQQMIYTTSMNWKNAGQNYHGFQDDTLLIGFGIENSFSAGIDIIAGDLFKNLALCS